MGQADTVDPTRQQELPRMGAGWLLLTPTTSYFGNASLCVCKSDSCLRESKISPIDFDSSI